MTAVTVANTTWGCTPAMVRPTTKTISATPHSIDKDAVLSALHRVVDPSAWQALQSLGETEALSIALEVEGKRGLRNVSAFIVSRVQKLRLEALLSDWGDKLDDRARTVLRSVPPRRAVEALMLLEAQKPVVRNPSAFVCSAAKGKSSWSEASIWPTEMDGTVYFPQAYQQETYKSWHQSPWLNLDAEMGRDPFLQSEERFLQNARAGSTVLWQGNSPSPWAPGPDDYASLFRRSAAWPEPPDHNRNLINAYSAATTAWQAQTLAYAQAEALSMYRSATPDRSMPTTPEKLPMKVKTSPEKEVQRFLL